MCEASSASGFPDLVCLNISLTNFFIFLEVVVNPGILKRTDVLTIPNSDLFSATDGAQGFFKYGLVILFTLSELGTEGLQYYVLGTYFM